MNQLNFYDLELRAIRLTKRLFLSVSRVNRVISKASLFLAVLQQANEIHKESLSISFLSHRISFITLNFRV